MRVYVMKSASAGSPKSTENSGQRTGNDAESVARTTLDIPSERRWAPYSNDVRFHSNDVGFQANDVG